MAAPEHDGLELSYEFTAIENTIRHGLFGDLYSKLDKHQLAGPLPRIYYFQTMRPDILSRTVLAIHNGGRKAAARETRIIVNEMVRPEDNLSDVQLKISEFQLRRIGNLLTKRTHTVPTNSEGVPLLTDEAGPWIRKETDSDEVELVLGRRYWREPLIDRPQVSRLELHDKESIARELLLIFLEHSSYDMEPVERYQFAEYVHPTGEA